MIKTKYRSVSQLIDGSPTLQELASLPPPVADRILFYDVAEGVWDYLEIGTGLTVASKTLDASGGTSLTSYELDFGAVPTPDKQFTITDAGVSASSKITIFPNANPATGRVGNDYAWDIITFSAIPATGTFELYATVVNGSVVGKRNIYYSVGA